MNNTDHPLIRLEKVKKIPLDLISILLVGLVLRLVNIGFRAIWYDDAFSILLARRNISEIIIGTAADTMPPGYYLLLHFWGLISQEIWFLRLLNVLFSLIAIMVIYAIVKHLHDTKAGLVAGFLVAISPFQIYHAQELRMYSILATALLFHLYIFILLIDDSRSFFSSRGLFIGFILSGVIALYTHNLAVFSFTGLNLVLLFQKRWRHLLQLFLAQIIMGLLFIPWLFLLPGQIQKIQTAFWTPKPGIIQIIQSVISILATLPLPQTAIFVVAVLIALILTLLVLKLKATKNWDKHINTIFIIMISPPVLLFIVSWFMRPIYVPRAFILSGILFYALTGLIVFLPRVDTKNTYDGNSFSSNKIDIPGKAVIALLMVLSIISIPYQYTYNLFPRSDFRSMINIAEQACDQDCVIIHDNKLSYFPSKVYSPDSNQVFIMDEPMSHNDSLAELSQMAMDIYAQKNIETTVNNYSDIRFVVFDKALQEYSAAGISEHPKIKWLKDNFILSEIKQVGDLQVHYFVNTK